MIETLTMVAVEERPSIGQVIGARLAAIMRKHGVTQGEVALRAGLSQPTISSLVAGSTKDPPVSTVIKVARFMGVAVQELLDEAEPTPSVDRLEDRVARLEEALRVLGAFHQTEASADEVAAELLERQADADPPGHVAKPPSRGRPRR